jgi:ribosomal peptide maturation radical SAM protein 1
MDAQQGQPNTILLVSMPWNALEIPSVQLGTLKAVLDRCPDLRTVTVHLNIAYMEFMKRRNPQLLPVADYRLIGNNSWIVGVGEWLFASALRSANAARDAAYFAFLAAEQSMPQTLIARLQPIRDLVPEFLEECASEILRSHPAVVGFTTSFSQNTASLALAKLLKHRSPGLKIVLGGANCSGSMGAVLHRMAPWIDVVVRGEAENVLVPLMRALVRGEPVPRMSGLCVRQGEESFVVDERDGGSVVDMGSVPVPCYDEYFARLESSSLAADLLAEVSILVENARGCWWGAKHHCTFCGLNGANMAFRSKSAHRVLEDLRSLSRKYNRLDFQAVDNIIDVHYLADLLPRIRDAGYDYRMFFETKANLSKDQVKLLHDSGVHKFQPGIESLSTPILALMRKGSTALQNIRLLKWASQYKVFPSWNLLYGFPDEPAEQYAQMAKLMESLVHLPPPNGPNRVRLDRYSPYHTQPQAFGLSNVRPCEYYAHVYDLPPGELVELAYHFEYDYVDGRDPDVYIGAVREVMGAWRRDYRRNANSLTMRRGPGFLKISDRRTNRRQRHYTLGEMEAAVYLGSDTGRACHSIWTDLPPELRERATVQDIEEFLDAMVSEGLAMKEGGRYMSLAILANH